MKIPKELAKNPKSVSLIICNFQNQTVKVHHHLSKMVHPVFQITFWQYKAWDMILILNFLSYLDNHLSLHLLSFPRELDKTWSSTMNDMQDHQKK
jgi:hypothetical protein